MTGGLAEMELVRRGDAVRMSVTYEGVAPLTIIISPAGSGPCLLETRHLSFRYEGTTITAEQERILRSMEHTLGPEDPRVRSARKTHEVLGSDAEGSNRGRA